jgi:Zn-dependent M28 family amino/carboxypeptidase
MALLAVPAALAVVPQAALAKPGDALGEKLAREVTVPGIMEHEHALQDIATLNGGTRASGTPGFTASADYVTARLQAAGYQVQRQSFEFPFFQENAPSVLERTAPDPATFSNGEDFATMEYSGTGDVTAPVEAVDVQVPPPAEPGSTSGCEPEDFAGFTAGDIALVQRGTCTFGEKAANAAAAGASAVVIFNEGQEGRTDVLAGTLGEPVAIPAIGTTFALGEDTVSRLRAGQAVTFHVTTDTLSETRTTENVLADLPGGDLDNTLVVGAHLDSVPAGPGVNDDGSGTSTDLEIAEELAATHGPPVRNHVRFAFWGAEEEGLLGSTYYVEHLPADQLAQIGSMLDFDMLASPNFVRFVYDGDGSEGANDPGPAGSELIEATFQRFFEQRGLAWEPTPFDGRSDYQAFIDNGIPAGGVFAGAEGIKTPEEAATYGGTAGLAYDPCYHQACDTVDNLNATALDQLGDSAAYATGVIAGTRACPTGPGRGHGRGHGHGPKGPHGPMPFD